MLLVQKPSLETIQRFLSAQAQQNYSYQAIGATANTPPTNYVVDRYQGELGEGQETFEAACQMLRRWEHFNLGWIQATPTTTPIQPGQVICVVARIMGLYWLNACRIVYTIDETTKTDGGEVNELRLRLRNVARSRRNGRRTISRRMEPRDWRRHLPHSRFLAPQSHPRQTRLPPRPSSPKKVRPRLPRRHAKGLRH